MIVSTAEVLRIAALAKLALQPGEAERLAIELASILGHMEVLARGVDGMGGVGGVGGVGGEAPQREDAPSATSLAFPAKRLSPSFDSGFFTVPRLAALDGDA